jgi:hypothetical protein
MMQEVLTSRVGRFVPCETRHLLGEGWSETFGRYTVTGIKVGGDGKDQAEARQEIQSNLSTWLKQPNNE